jgi:Zn-finger nucleic acid-binding protein
MLTCPNDGNELTTVQIERVPVDQCPVCGGYWLDRGELETLAEKHGAHLNPIQIGDISLVSSTRRCPQDKTPLHKHKFTEHSDVQLEQCPQCQGIWLEMTDLTSVLDYLDAGGDYNDPTLSEQVMLFLYQLTKNPPFV